MMKLLVKFEKRGNARYISHLDLLRNVQRTLMRMNAPVTYSQGFNPHPILSFAQALPLGMESQGEYFELGMEQQVDLADFLQSFNDNSIDGIRAVHARPMGKAERAPMAQTAAAGYFVPLPQDQAQPIASAAQSLLAMEQYTYEKKGKKGISTVDMRQLIYNLSVDDTGITCLIACGQNNLAPSALLQALFNLAGIEIKGTAERIIRLEIYCNQGGALIPLYDVERSD